MAIRGHGGGESDGGVADNNDYGSSDTRINGGTVTNSSERSVMDDPSNPPFAKHRRMTTFQRGLSKLPKEVRSIVAGGIAGMIAKTVVAPLERIKILYQVSAETFVLRKVPFVMLNIVQKEGLTALWKGNTATMLRVFPYSGIQFMVFDQCKTYLLKEHERQDRASVQTLPSAEPALPPTPTGEAEVPEVIVKRSNTSDNIKHFGLSPLESLLSGMIAGAVSVMCTYPLDLTRAQLALYRTHKHSANIGFLGVLKHNHGLGGIRGLFRGLSPTILGILPYSGIAFALNEQGKREIQIMTKRDLTTVERMQCGAVAGLLAQTFAYPFEVTRRRMQTIGVAPLHGKEAATDALGFSSGADSKAKNMLGTMKVLYTEQGVRGFFKGVTMNWMRGPIAFSISFTMFDTIKHLLETPEERNMRLPEKLRETYQQST